MIKNKPWRPCLLVWKTKHSTDYLRCDTREDYFASLAYIFDDHYENGSYYLAKSVIAAEFQSAFGMTEEMFLSLPSPARDAVLKVSGHQSIDKFKSRRLAENNEIDEIILAHQTKDPAKKAAVVLSRADYDYERVSQEYFLELPEDNKNA